MRKPCVVAASMLLAVAIARAEPVATSSTTYALCGQPACVLVDRDGKPVMARVFERIEPMVGNIAIFGKGPLAGVVDRQGRTVLELQFRSVIITDNGRIWASETHDDGSGLGTLFDASGQVIEHDTKAPAPNADAPRRAGRAVEILKTPSGVRLGDGQGRAVSETFAHIYAPGEEDVQSMLAVQGEDSRKRYFQLFRDGRALAFPEGGQLDVFREAVATWRVRVVDAQGAPRTLQGLLDDRGLVVMPATFDEIGYARGGVLRFREGQRWGIADVHGRIRTPATYSGIDFFSHAGLFGVRAVDGAYGVVDADGHWIVPARFKEIGWLDDTLIAATEATVDATGQPDLRTSLFERSGMPWRGPAMRYAPMGVGLGLLLAYDLDSKHMLLDRQGGVVVRDVQGGGDYELPDTVNGPFFAKRDGLFAVVAPYGPELSPKRFYMVRQPFRNGRALADDSLLDEHGQVIASYQSAAPPGVAWPDDVDARFEAAVDPCFNADPTETAALPEPMNTVCNDPALHASLRESVLLGFDDAGDVISAIDSANRFQAQLLACIDRTCLAKSLQDRLVALRSTPSVAPQAIRTVKTPVPTRLRRRLQALAGGSVDLGDGAAWSYIDLRGDGRRQVMAWAVEGMHNNPFAIWAETGGRWRLLLSDDANGVQTSPGGRASAGWPDLLVSQHGGAADSGLEIYRHRGIGYMPLATCALHWSADPKEPMSRQCDGEKSWPARPSASPSPH